MNLKIWKFIARDNDEDQECWVCTHEPEWQQHSGVWACGDDSGCEFADEMGIPKKFWPAPGECRRIAKFEIVIETERPVEHPDLAVDTPVWVREYDEALWCARHFAGWEGNLMVCWQNGETSHSSNGKKASWKCWRLDDPATVERPDLAMDTPVWVRNEDNEPWEPRHFAEWCGNLMVCWEDGTTSHSSEGTNAFWKYWRLDDPAKEAIDK